MGAMRDHKAPASATIKADIWNLGLTGCPGSFGEALLEHWMQGLLPGLGPACSM